LASLDTQIQSICEVTGCVANGDFTRSITIESHGTLEKLKQDINRLIMQQKATLIKKTQALEELRIMRGHKEAIETARKSARSSFLRMLIVLSSDSHNSESKSLWAALPRDIQMLLLEHVCIEWPATGSHPSQMIACSVFVMRKDTHVKAAALLKHGQLFRIVENSRSHFRVANLFDK
jgi:hypothetical protein